MQVAQMSVVCYNNKVVRMRKAQAALEYVLALASLLVVVTVMWGLIRASWKQAERTVKLVVSECP